MHYSVSTYVLVTIRNSMAPVSPCRRFVRMSYAKWSITLLFLLTQAGWSQNAKGVANIDTVLANLPTYEAFCDAADARIAAIRDPSLPNVATGIVNAQMRCATIRQFREMIANDPTFFNSLSFPASKFDVWKAGVTYFLAKAEANQDPFAGMTSGLRAFRSKMDGQLLFYVFRLPPDYATSNRYPLDVYLHTSGTRDVVRTVDGRSTER